MLFCHSVKCTKPPTSWVFGLTVDERIELARKAGQSSWKNPTALRRKQVSQRLKRTAPSREEALRRLAKAQAVQAEHRALKAKTKHNLRKE